VGVDGRDGAVARQNVVVQLGRAVVEGGVLDEAVPGRPVDDQAGLVERRGDLGDVFGEHAGGDEEVVAGGVAPLGEEVEAGVPGQGDDRLPGGAEPAHLLHQLT